MNLETVWPDSHVTKEPSPSITGLTMGHLDISCTYNEYLEHVAFSDYMHPVARRKQVILERSRKSVGRLLTHSGSLSYVYLKMGRCHRVTIAFSEIG